MEEVEVEEVEEVEEDSPDGELEVPGDDARLLVVARGVAGQFEDLGGQVLYHGGHVDEGAGSHPLGVVALPAEDLGGRPAGRRLRRPGRGGTRRRAGRGGQWRGPRSASGRASASTAGGR